MANKNVIVIQQMLQKNKAHIVGMVVEGDPEIAKEVFYNQEDYTIRADIILIFYFIFKHVRIDGILSEVGWCRNTKIGVKYSKLNLI